MFATGSVEFLCSNGRQDRRAEAFPGGQGGGGDEWGKGALKELTKLPLHGPHPLKTAVVLDLRSRGLDLRSPRCHLFTLRASQAALEEDSFSSVACHLLWIPGEGSRMARMTLLPCPLLPST